MPPSPSGRAASLLRTEGRRRICLYEPHPRRGQHGEQLAMRSPTSLDLDKEACAVLTTKCEGDPGSRTAPDEARVNEMTQRLRDALSGLDRGRALYVVVSALVGEDPDRELAIIDPDTGHVLAYLVPAAERHALRAATRPGRHAVVAGDPPATLDQ